MQNENNGPEPAKTNEKQYTTHDEVQKDYTMELSRLFNATRENLICVHEGCTGKGKTISNKGKGGGVLQQGIIGNQYKCNACGRCTNLGNLLEKSGLTEERQKFDDMLVKYKTLAGKLDKPTKKQSSMTDFFLSPQTNSTAEASASAEPGVEPTIVSKGKEVIGSIKNTADNEKEIDALKKKLENAQELIKTKQNMIDAQKSEILELKNKIVKMTDYFIEKTTVEQTMQNTRTKQNGPKKPQANLAALEDAPFQAVTYARAAKKPNANNQLTSKSVMKRMIQRTTTERVDEAKEFKVLHIALQNTRDVNRLLQQRKFDTLNELLKNIIKKYDIQKEVIKFSRIGKSILEVYVAADDVEEVEAKVNSRSGWFEEDVQPGRIKQETLNNVTEETRQWIAGTIINKAARQFRLAPTVNFRKAVIENYKGPFMEWILKTILDDKQKFNPARPGNKWIIKDFTLQQTLIKQKVNLPEVPTKETSWEECIENQTTILESETPEMEVDENQAGETEAERTDRLKRKAQDTPAETAANLC
jgi:hypothetical protein